MRSRVSLSAFSAGVPLGRRVLPPGALAVVMALAGVSAASSQAPSDVACDKCHASQGFLARVAPVRAGMLFVPDSLVRGTAHDALACTACHADYTTGYPHPRSSRTMSCQSCHTTEAGEWAVSIHAAAEAAADAPTCIGCHGGPHTVYGVDHRQSPTHPLNIAATCGRCHTDPSIIGTYFMAPEEAQARTAVSQYYQTVHGTALTRAGLIISATCNDCHGSHMVLPDDSLESSIHRSNIAATCGACHVGVLEVYEAGSAHGSAYRTERLTSNGLAAPVCVDCHSAHQVVHANQPEWFLGTSVKCGSCHTQLWKTYLETYHGQVTRLGYGLTAKCSDCHTPHNMRPASDVRSSVHPVNLVATCSKCHPSATTSFVKYYAHGDFRDRRRYPVLFWPWVFMTTLLVSVWSFFGLHSLLWFSGLAFERRRKRSTPRGQEDHDA